MDTVVVFQVNIILVIKMVANSTKRKRIPPKNCFRCGNPCDGYLCMPCNMSDHSKQGYVSRLLYRRNNPR